MKKIITNSLNIFLLCFILHFLYHILKIPVLRIFLPTKESIFEHIKLLFTANILFSLLKKDTSKYLKALIRGILSNIILLVIYTPIFLKMGEILPLTLFILLISILISEFFTSKIKKYPKKVEYYSIFIILTIYYILLYLTDYPPNNLIFKVFSK